MPEKLEPNITSPEAARRYEVNDVVENIVFNSGKSKRGDVYWRSSAPDRKMIELADNSPAPEEGKNYRVKVIADTNPDDPLSGKYVVSLIELSEASWREVEEHVNLAEESLREQRAASNLLYELTQVPKAKRKAGDYEPEGRVGKAAQDTETIMEGEAKGFLGTETSWEREFVAFEQKNLIQALKADHRNEELRQALRAEEAEILKELEGQPTGAELGALEDIRRELAKLEQEKEALFAESPEAFFGLHLKDLKENKDQLESGRIVETPYVKQHVEDIVSHFRAGKPVLIYGHLGSGKTELARHVAKNYIGKEPFVISGSKHTSLMELYGHQVLTVDKIDRAKLDEYIREVEEKFSAWRAENTARLQALPAEERQVEEHRAHDRILQIYLTQFKGGTISDFFLGPVYKAMEEGRPVLIDEVNAIPHEVLISLNDILTRRPGEQVAVQQDKGRTVTIKEGFGIFMTGNLNQGEERYRDREVLDPAFLSRLHRVEYDYLPQKKEGGLKEEAGKGNELFQLLLARVMDRHGNVEAPQDVFVKLWKLAKGARITQDVFAGREVSNSYYFQEGGARSVRYILKEAVLSIRAIENVITQWQREGFKRSLDYYIWHDFVSQATSPQDRAYLYQLFQDRVGLFDEKEGWPKPVYGNIGAIGSFSVAPSEKKPEDRKFFGPRETIKIAFGEPPKRAKWPEVAAKKTKRLDL